MVTIDQVCEIYEAELFFSLNPEDYQGEGKQFVSTYKNLLTIFYQNKENAKKHLLKDAAHIDSNMMKNSSYFKKIIKEKEEYSKWLNGRLEAVAKYKPAPEMKEFYEVFVGGERLKYADIQSGIGVLRGSQNPELIQKLGKTYKILCTRYSINYNKMALLKEKYTKLLCKH